jgi:hypothetical protein
LDRSSTGIYQNFWCFTDFILIVKDMPEGSQQVIEIGT